MIFKQGFLCDINIKRKTPVRIGKIYVHVIRLEKIFILILFLINNISSVHLH